MTIKRGDTVRLTSDLMFVDGSSFPSGTEFNVARLFNVKTGAGQIERRIAISNCGVLLRQVRLEDVEKQ